MSRRITGGLVGDPSLVGTVQISPDSRMTTAPGINLALAPGGSVLLEKDAQLSGQSDLRFADSDSSNWVAFQAPAVITSNVTWTLPAADGTNLQTLTTNGSGTLSWQTTALSLSNENADSATNYLVFTNQTGSLLTSSRISTTNITYQPSTGTLTVAGLTVNGPTRDLRTENVRTSSYTIQLTDRNLTVNMNNTSSATLTVPADSTVNFPVGSVVYVFRSNSGAVRIEGGGGVTLRVAYNTDTAFNMEPREEVWLRKRAANEWVISPVPVSPRVPTSVTGGSVSTSGGFTIHTFTSSDTFNVS